MSIYSPRVLLSISKVMIELKRLADMLQCMGHDRVIPLFLSEKKKAKRGTTVVIQENDKDESYRIKEVLPLSVFSGGIKEMVIRIETTVLGEASRPPKLIFLALLDRHK